MPGTQQVLKQYLRNDRKGKVTPAPRESVTLSELCVCGWWGGIIPFSSHFHFSSFQGTQNLNTRRLLPCYLRISSNFLTVFILFYCYITTKC